MSCFVVNDYHVNALVAWAVARDVLPHDVSPDALAHKLASANRAAFTARYAMAQPFEGFDFELVDASHLVPVAVVKACDCLEYQASDWPSWHESKACAHLAAIRAGALALALAGLSISARASAGGLDYGRELPGYDAAAWELVDPAELAAERLAATLASMPEHEVNAIRSALAATRCAA